jgi:hypothetical protein
VSFVNRVALIVRPKRRYKEWADSVSEGDEDPIFDLDEARATPAVYLVAPSDDASLQDLIDRYAEDIFEEQLEGWHTDDAAWPANRSAHVFRDWFDVSLGPWVVDLDDAEPFEADEFDEGDDELIEALSGAPGTKLFCAWCHSHIDENAEVTTVSLAGARVPQPTLEIIDLRVADRIVPAVVPSDDSPAGKKGVAAIIMFCSKDCGRAFEDAWSRERGLLDS